MPELSDRETIKEARGHGGNESGERAERELTGKMENSDMEEEERRSRRKVVKVEV